MGSEMCIRDRLNRIVNLMETTNFGFVASLLFVGVPTIFLIGLFISTQDGEKSSFYSDSSKGRLGPKR